MTAIVWNAPHIEHSEVAVASDPQFGYREYRIFTFSVENGVS
jgi:hypothetical protein